jgi:MFS family permease
LPAATAGADGHQADGVGGARGQEHCGTVLRDRLLVSCFLLMLIETSVYMQAFTTLPYGFAMAVNGIVIVALQPVAGAWLGRHDHATVIACGIAFLGLGYALTALASTTWEYAGSVGVWTIGEILANATAVAVVSAMAPPRARSRRRGSWRSGPPSAGEYGRPRDEPGTVRYKFLS